MVPLLELLGWVMENPWLYALYFYVGPAIMGLLVLVALASAPGRTVFYFIVIGVFIGLGGHKLGWDIMAEIGKWAFALWPLTALLFLTPLMVLMVRAPEPKWATSSEDTQPAYSDEEVYVDGPQDGPAGCGYGCFWNGGHLVQKEGCQATGHSSSV